MTDVVEKKVVKHIAPVSVCNDDSGYVEVVDTIGKNDIALIELIINGDSIYLDFDEAITLRDWLDEWIPVHPKA